jgi:hypothetical protein
MKHLIASIVILLSFSSISQQKLIPFEKTNGEGWGYISTEGKVVIEPSYKEALPFSEGGIALVFDFKSKRWLFIDVNNSELKLPYKSFEPKNYFGFGKRGFEEGVAQILVKKKIALINTKGEEVYPPEFDKMSLFVQDRSIGTIGNEWYFLDREGTRTKVQPACIEVNYLKNGYAPYRSPDKKFGFVNEKGAVVIEAKFQSVGYFFDGVAWAKTKDKKVGFINTSGEWVIEPTFDAVTDFDNSSGIARVKADDKWSYLRKSGETFEIANATKLGEFHEGRAWVRVGEQHGYIDEKGAWIVEPQYLKTNNFENGIAYVRQGDYWGMINLQGEVILDIKYDRLNVLSEGLIAIREGAQFGFANLTGTVVIEPQFEGVRAFKNGYAAVKKDGKWGIIDETGNLVIPTENNRIKDVSIIK